MPRYNLQVIAEWMGGLIKAGNPVIAEIGPVQAAALNSPAAVAEFVMTLDSGQRYDVTVRECE